MVRDDIERLIDARIRECREDMEERLDHSHDQLNGEISRVRTEMHSITLQITEMSGYLKTIAETMTKLADLPDTWTKIKGFWAVLSWARDNWAVIVFLLASVLGTVYLGLVLTGLVSLPSFG